MTVEEFVSALQCLIKEEFIAISKVSENTINVQFFNGQCINVVVT